MVFLLPLFIEHKKLWDKKGFCERASIMKRGKICTDDAAGITTEGNFFYARFHIIINICLLFITYSVHLVKMCRTLNEFNHSFIDSLNFCTLFWVQQTKILMKVKLKMFLNWDEIPFELKHELMHYEGRKLKTSTLF